MRRWRNVNETFQWTGALLVGSGRLQCNDLRGVKPDSLHCPSNLKTRLVPSNRSCRRKLYSYLSVHPPPPLPPSLITETGLRSTTTPLLSNSSSLPRLHFQLLLIKRMLFLASSKINIGSFPSSLKTAALSTVAQKPGLDPALGKDYTPISNPLFLAKVLKEGRDDTILARLVNPASESAFRFPPTFLFSVLLDFGVAVDTVNHGVLISRLIESKNEVRILFLGFPRGLRSRNNNNNNNKRINH